MVFSYVMAVEKARLIANGAILYPAETPFCG
jgi:hypothetical protein